MKLMFFKHSLFIDTAIGLMTSKLLYLVTPIIRQKRILRPSHSSNPLSN